MEIELNGISWRAYNGALIPDIPPHIEIELSKEHQNYLINKSRAYFLRWTTDFDCGFETDWWYVIKDGKSSIEELDTKRRNEVRNGLKNCVVKKVDGQYITKFGYDIYIKAFNRYDTYSKPVTHDNFSKSILNTLDDSSFHYWGVFDREYDRLIAYSQNIVKLDCCNYSVVKLDPEYLKLYPAYALFYEMNNYYLNKKNLLYVSDGARSISHKTNIQDFLINKFKFRKAYCKLNIVYRSDIKKLVLLMYPFANVIGRLNNSFCDKLNVIIRQEKIRRSFDSP